MEVTYCILSCFFISVYFWADPLLSAQLCKHITLLLVITVIAYVLRVSFFFSLQVWVFHSCAISATRFYVQDERQITTDPCDNRLIVLFETWGVCVKESICGMYNVMRYIFFISELFNSNRDFLCSNSASTIVSNWFPLFARSWPFFTTGFAR